MARPPAVCAQALLAAIGRPAAAGAGEQLRAGVPCQIHLRPEPLAALRAHVRPAGVHLAVVLLQQLERGEVFFLARGRDVILAVHHRAEVGESGPRTDTPVRRPPAGHAGPLEGDVLTFDDLAHAVNGGPVLRESVQGGQHLNKLD